MNSINNQGDKLMTSTLRFSDGRIKLFSYIMLNLGTYTSFQYGNSGINVSIEGNQVSFCSATWQTLWTTVL